MAQLREGSGRASLVKERIFIATHEEHGRRGRREVRPGGSACENLARERTLSPKALYEPEPVSLRNASPAHSFTTQATSLRLTPAFSQIKSNYS